MSIRKEQKMKLSFNLINKKFINFPLIFKSILGINIILLFYYVLNQKSQKTIYK